MTIEIHAAETPSSSHSSCLPVEIGRLRDFINGHPIWIESGCADVWIERPGHMNLKIAVVDDGILVESWDEEHQEWVCHTSIENFDTSLEPVTKGEQT